MCDREVLKWEMVIALSHFLSANKQTGMLALILLSLNITSQIRKSTAFLHHIPFKISSHHQMNAPNM